MFCSSNVRFLKEMIITWDAPQLNWCHVFQQHKDDLSSTIKSVCIFFYELVSTNHCTSMKAKSLSVFSLDTFLLFNLSIFYEESLIFLLKFLSDQRDVGLFALVSVFLMILYFPHCFALWLAPLLLVTLLFQSWCSFCSTSWWFLPTNSLICGFFFLFSL